MSLIGRMMKRARAAGARPRLEREMQEEMREHIAQAAERFRARGMPEAEAAAAARREFGNVGVLQEQARDARGARWIESALGDLRHAVRQYARTPLLAGTIIITLTLGIGVSAAAFSVLAGILTRPAPGVPSDNSLVTIRGIQRADGRRYARHFSYAELMEYAGLPEFREVAGVTESMVVVDIAGQSAGTAQTQFVTPNFFRALGISINPGSAFVQNRFDEHSVPEMTAVLARLYATEKFGVPEAAIGKIIRVNGQPVRIVGVAAPRFVGAFSAGDHRVLWMPVSAWPVIDRLTGEAFSKRSEGEFLAVARMREGMSIARATPGVEVVAARATQAQSPGEIRKAGRNSTLEADVVLLRGDSRFKSSHAGDFMAVGMTFVCVVLILLVCTTNVSSLLVGASVARRHEIAVRLALGASRARIIRQLLTENLLLAVVAGAAGLAAFAMITRSIHDSVVDVNVDPTWMTAFATAAFAMATALLCGLTPALHATRDAVAGVLKDSSTNATVKSRLQRVFVVAQIALTQPLLLGLAVAIAVVMREGGHTPAEKMGEHVVRARFAIWSAAAQANDGLAPLRQRIAALPGVVSVLQQSSGVRVLKIGTPLAGPTRVRTNQIAPGYFKMMDIHLLRGREFMDADTVLHVSPIIIGSDFAAHAFGDVDPIGRRMPTLLPNGQRDGEVEVIGVVAVADIGESEHGDDIVIFSTSGGPLSVNLKPDGMLIRTTQPGEAMIATFREMARGEAPMAPIEDIQTLAQIERDTRSEIVEAASSAAVGGVVALFLASIGLYAVVALGVGQRRREIGVRISLGARPSQVVSLFFRGGLRVSLLGLAIGLPLSAAVMAVVGSQVGMPRANLPVIALAVALSVVAVASLASWIPARRAAGVDPLQALRDG